VEHTCVGWKFFLCVVSIAPSEVADYVSGMCRSSLEWSRTSHNDWKADPVSSSGKVFKAKFPSPIPYEGTHPVGFNYTQAKEVEYGPPKIGSYYYVAVPVRDDGTMRCRVTSMCPSARFKPMGPSSYGNVAVDLVVGYNAREIRDYYTPPHDVKKWTVFRFFVKSRYVLPSFATVYNGDRIFGVVKLTDHGRLCYSEAVVNSDLFSWSENSFVVSGMVDGHGKCWHSSTNSLTTLVQMSR